MNKPRKTGLYASGFGILVAALCCFTPLLVIMLGVVGLGALTAHLDYVLFPVLALFTILFLILYRRYKQKCKECGQ